jgi:hypothetical protein
VLDLATYGAVALGLYVIFALIRLPFLRKKKARQAHAEAAAAQAAAEQKQAEQDDEPFANQGPSRFANPPVAPANGSSGRYRVEPKL